jgi:hypothetical protein
VKIPYMTQLLTNKKNPRKKDVKEWVSDPTNFDSIETETPEVKEYLKELIDNSTKFTGKNADLTGNNGIRNMIDKSNDQCDRVGYAYKTLEQNTVTVVSYPSTETLWLIFLDKEQEIVQTEEEDDVENGTPDYGNIYVLDKCVFKV